MTETMFLGFTGTRRGMTQPQREAVARVLRQRGMHRQITFHHGGAFGADQGAAEIAYALGYEVRTHLPAGRAPADYLARNHAIVDIADELLAAPAGMEEELRSGTWATIRYARKERRMVTVVWPDGTISFDP